MMRMARFTAVLVIAGAAGGGCTYLDAKSDLRNLQAQEAASKANLQAEQTKNQSLQDQQLQIQRDSERMEQRLKSAKDDLVKSKAQLAEAQKNNKLSKAQADNLNNQVAALNRDISSLNLNVQAGSVSGQEDPAEVQKKEQQVRDLEKRKVDLERAIQLSIAPK